MTATEGIPEAPPPGPIEWLVTRWKLRKSNPVEFVYSKMASQSDRGLPLIYEQFDGKLKAHFSDRGQVLDFAVCGGGGTVLDFGPGDGWPSLPMASLAERVVGVEACSRRVEECRENAGKMDVSNAEFVLVLPGDPLPFEDASFDAVAAASSVEQTPDPVFVIAEFFRVLKPGGCLRMTFEGLDRYRSGAENDLTMWEFDGRTRLLLYDRKPDLEMARHLGLVIDMPLSRANAMFASQGERPSFAGLTDAVLERLTEHLLDAVAWSSAHPNASSWIAMLEEAGFGDVRPTWNGGHYARQLYERLGVDQIPRELEAVDAMLKPLVEPVVNLRAPTTVAPGGRDPWIIAIK